MVLKKDPTAHCNIRTMGGYGKVWVTGEVSSTIDDYEIKNIIYDISGITDSTVHLRTVSDKSDGANNQCIAIGYASIETPTFMPFEYELTRGLTKYIYEVYPVDGKVQVTVNGSDAVVIASFQNTKQNDLEELIQLFFREKSEELVRQNITVSKTLCNPLGDWTVGGLDGDSGITGGQIVIDNYGPRIPIGGGHFSGKDITKIDRCAAYMARTIAVDALRKYRLMYALVELSYSIGKTNPVQARIKGNNAGINMETGIKLYEVTDYDLSVEGIINHLKLDTLNLADTAAWGHFGNNLFHNDTI
jgi:S-adenosylmethionine synthetase